MSCVPWEARHDLPPRGFASVLDAKACLKVYRASGNITTHGRDLTASRRDLVEVQRRSCGEDQIVCRAVDQPGSVESDKRVGRVARARVAVRPVTNKLIDRPRPLIVRVKKAKHHAPIVHVVGLFGWVRLYCGHGSYASCAQAPARTDPLRRSRMEWTAQTLAVDPPKMYVS